MTITESLISNYLGNKKANKNKTTYKENKYYKPFETLELLCRLVHFKKQIGFMMLFIGNLLSHNESSGITSSELKELMTHIAKGMISNSSALAESLIPWLFEGFKCVVSSLKEKRQTTLWKKDFGRDRNDFFTKVVAKPLNSTTETYLQKKDIILFHDLFYKNHKYLLTEYENCADSRGILGPLLPHITHVLTLRNFNDKIILSRTICSILCLSILPNANMWISKYAKNILSQPKQTGFKKKSAEIYIRLITALLKHSMKYNPKKSQLKYIIFNICVKIDNYEPSNTTLLFIIEIFKSKLVFPAVYKLMDGKIQNTMIRSHSAFTRELCRRSLLYFLLNFPTGEKRLQWNIDFLITNCNNYKYDTGRSSALNMIRRLIQKLPNHILSSKIDLFLFPLATRLVVDPASHCRLYAMDCLRPLLQKISSQNIDRIISYLTIWLDSREDRSALVSLQLANLIIHTNHQNRVKCLNKLLERMIAILIQKKEMDLISNGIENGHNLCSLSSFTLIKSLQIIEKIFIFKLENIEDSTNSPKSDSGRASTRLLALLWEVVIDLLTHPHLAVRSEVTRLIGRAIGDPNKKHLLLSIPEMSKMMRLGNLAMCFLRQFDTSDDEVLNIMSIKLLCALAIEMIKRTESIRDNAKKNYENTLVFQKTANHKETSRTRIDILTLHGLIRRKRLSTDKSFFLHAKRLMAIKWILTITKAMGSQFHALRSEKMS